MKVDKRVVQWVELKAALRGEKLVEWKAVWMAATLAEPMVA